MKNRRIADCLGWCPAERELARHAGAARILSRRVGAQGNSAPSPGGVAYSVQGQMAMVSGCWLSTGVDKKSMHVDTKSTCIESVGERRAPVPAMVVPARWSPSLSMSGNGS